MTTRIFPLRARGSADAGLGRGPQIAGGTFEGFLGAADANKPAHFTAISWSPGEFPAIELWAYRVKKDLDSSDNGLTFGPISAGQALWLDKVPTAEFQPPTGQAPDSTATVSAFRQYAHDRTKDAGRGDQLDNWEVIRSRPFQSAHSALPDDLVDADKVYVVKQTIAGGEFITGWLWVPDLKHRFVWLHYLPNEPGGYEVVGSTPLGAPAPVTSTRLHFSSASSTPDGWSLATYGSTIASFKQWALDGYESPATTLEELQLLDYRLEPNTK